MSYENGDRKIITVVFFNVESHYFHFLLVGTILSGFSILCCGKCRVQTKDDQRLVTLCVNVCVGVSQLFTVTFLLVGWFWSIAWGVNMVLLAGM